MSEPRTLRKLLEKPYLAGVMLSYRCTIACRHCLFACKPGNPDAVMSVADAVTCIEEFSKLDRIVHLSGGEPFMFYDVLLSATKASSKRGFPPHMVQTNCSWCNSDEIVAERFKALRDLGMLGMYFSSDPYHQEFVPAENVRRAIRIATTIFGPDNIVGSGSAVPENADELENMTRDEEKLRERVRSAPPRMVGRAFFALSRYLDERPVSQLVQDRIWGPHWGPDNCAVDFDPATMMEVHGDPYGNLQTNCGIILGNIRDNDIAEVMTKDYIARHPIAGILATEGADGPFKLLEIAEEKGYRRREKYAQKCSLCFEVRSFLRPYYPQFFGPQEIYED